VLTPTSIDSNLLMIEKVPKSLISKTIFAELPTPVSSARVLTANPLIVASTTLLETDELASSAEIAL
jgi:hypothetical protein